MSEDQKKQLEQQLWNIANTLRGKMNADEFRDYILGFIFYKYLSEKMETYADSILEEDGITYQDVDESSPEGKKYLEAIKEESLVKLGYFLKPSELFSAVARRGNGTGKEHNGEKQNKFILEDLGAILNNIEQSTMGTDSEDDFDNLFEDLDLASTKLGKTVAARNELISKVLAHLDNIDFQLENVEADVLGDAYEYLIAQFASGAGKKAGEFYTPQEVSKVLAKLVTVGKKKLKSVYDPTCGSGSLLLRVAKEVKDVGKFYGQELNRTTYNLARMNMILHGVHYQKFDLRQEDSLEHPLHIDERFEAIVANPPFSAKWSASPLHLGDDRFSQYGRLAPASRADFAFIQHMVHHLADNGTIAVVAPHGVLYRGNAEGHIRQYLIQDRNYLDAVIGLPENIFYGTTYATCILVLKKCREHPDDILFIDASRDFGKRPTQNFLRSGDIEKIVRTYEQRSVEDRYSYIASLAEIAENGYNLNIPRYIDIFGDEVQIDLKGVTTALSDIAAVSIGDDRVIAKFCEELNIPKPSGNDAELLVRFKRGLMQQIFDQVVRFRDDSGNDFPDWQELLLGDLFTFRTTNSFSREDLNYDGGTVKNIHYGDIHTRFRPIVDVDREQIPFINPGISLKKIPEANYLRPGDIVFADASEDYADVGKCVEIGKTNGERILAGLHTLLARPLPDTLAPGFGTYLMKSSAVRKQIMREAQGTKVLGISAPRLGKVKLLLPALDEQRKIADFLTAMDSGIELVANRISETRRSSEAAVH